MATGSRSGEADRQDDQRRMRTAAKASVPGLGVFSFKAPSHKSSRAASRFEQGDKVDARRILNHAAPVLGRSDAYRRNLEKA